MGNVMNLDFRLLVGQNKTFKYYFYYLIVFTILFNQGNNQQINQ